MQRRNLHTWRCSLPHLRDALVPARPEKGLNFRKLRIWQERRFSGTGEHHVQTTAWGALCSLGVRKYHYLEQSKMNTRLRYSRSQRLT